MLGGVGYVQRNKNLTVAESDIIDLKFDHISQKSDKVSPKPTTFAENPTT